MTQIQNKHQFYFPELDALRTLAISLTLIAHYFPCVGWPLIPYSWYGVDVFFSISGFLITYSLMISGVGDAKKSQVWKNFIIRRTLRLFPIYYLFLLFFFLSWKFFHLQMWKPIYSTYFFTYLPNFLFYKEGMEFAPGFSHLWSLGVEEQFYLVWPLFIIFLNRKNKFYAIIFFIIIGIASHVLGFNIGDVRLMPIANFHTLGIGALIAYLSFYCRDKNYYLFIVNNRHCISLFSITILVLVLVLFQEENWIWQLLRESSLVIATLSLVVVSIYGWSNLFSWFSTNRIVIYFGKISYGIYLYHLPVPFIYIILKDKFGISIHNSFALFFTYIITTIVVAIISYHFIEVRFLRLKNRFA
jgi:peptidoglycan/LPS O-acetylase OafA/YrhL